MPFPEPRMSFPELRMFFPGLPIFSPDLRDSSPESRMRRTGLRELRRGEPARRALCPCYGLPCGRCTRPD